jgi:hypothetical protein
MANLGFWVCGKAAVAGNWYPVVVEKAEVGSKKWLFRCL